ncbi:CU044_5270 family protein [Streptomyces sp. B3I8]|uniref:CU044_5270 family protein n=1 Tax=Streptomyces sp. B3I8 TaxID=3042303 RepID=UPI00277DD82D|nr:CU044_5270 family protein [Streptomyces sp. B3I8]MDQ0787692.1 hypothetical protein [Streptomyces sp. B3I8]
MNASGHGPGRADGDDTARASRELRETRAELARLLPAPPERELPPERHLHHKERLMRLIDNDQARAGATAHAGTDAHTAGAAPRRPLLPRPALWLPVAALALAGALTVTLVTHDATGTRADTATSATPTGSATVLLDRIAAVAADTDAAPVRDDQFTYVKSLTAGAEGQPDGSFVPGRLHEREIWKSQRSGPVKQVGLIHEDGGYAPLREFLPAGSPGVSPGIDRPTYTWLASLPTDPATLLRKLYRLTPVQDGQERDQAVFDRIGELLHETVMPPENAAALYKAAARIPGVTRREDATDPAGRHGVAILRVDAHASTATEWIFDRKTLAFLGERSYLTHDVTAGRKGTVMEETAVLRRAVVDAYRERPSGS